MDHESVFNRYDVRGSYPEEIDAGFARRMGRAAGTYAIRNGERRIVVGRDLRESSGEVQEAFVSGARSAGTGVVDVGTGPTDRTALAGNHYGSTSVMITASHHDWERTGFKFMYERGNGFSNEDMEEIKDIFLSGEFEVGEGSLMKVESEFDETYMENVRSAFEKISGEIDSRVVVDTSMQKGRLIAETFRELGAETVTVEREGIEPEPTEDNREHVRKAMEGEGADLAVGFDPDADRVYAFHPSSGWIDGNRIFYLLARILEPGSIVASADTSPLIETLDSRVEYSRVGDIFVAERGVEVGAELLGEPNGHYAVTDFCWYNSGLFSGLLLASIPERIEEFLRPVEDFRTVQRTLDFETEEERDHEMERLEGFIRKEYEIVERVDGTRFRADGCTGLLRPSGTSPKIRLTVHGSGETEMNSVVKSLE